MDTEILIVGAGPTGLMLANQLGRRGVRAMIIDRHSGPAQQTRAIGVQARTLEIYSKLGIVQQALELGFRTKGGNIWAEGRRKARIPVGDIGQSLSPFPFVFMLGQDDNERIMGEKLREWGVSVQWNTELISLEQHPDHVAVTLKQPDGSTRAITASWVAGCDGARSPVREICGISFPGAPYEHTFFVADTVATGDMVPAELNVYLWKDGFHLFFPVRGKNGWRVIGILPRQLRSRENLTFDDVIPHLRREAGARTNFESCHWFSTYRILHRSASHFRDRRCFLLGDAAHIHSPMGAQGMNTGLQDAYNLAWKLALVIKGQADSALLDSYEAERMPVAQRLLNTTDRIFRLIVSESWIAGMFRTRILANVAAIAMRRERVQQLFFRTISQIGIRYPKSPLSEDLAGLPAGAPSAGDRFPWLQLKFQPNAPVEDLFEKLDDTRFSLLVMGQAAGAIREFGNFVRLVKIPTDPVNDKELARAKISGPSFYLLRPDGHVGLAGTRFDPALVTRYFTDRQIRFRLSQVTKEVNRWTSEGVKGDEYEREGWRVRA
jgi:2-polyprenyl-6-methoxyphenol hydroxylase-like FAD-dependent oxidoreductase